MHNVLIFCVLSLLLILDGWSSASAQEIGPANGSLVIVGGGRLDADITNRFIQLAGGEAAVIVVIPTAGGAPAYDSFYPGLNRFRAGGAAEVKLLHTYDRAEADTDEFASVIDNATGVWFAGGRQWRLADSYLHTKTHDALWRLLDRGGVIGGSSAGATIQGSYLARGDTKTNTIMMGDHEEGMAFLKQSAIDQHLLRRNRQFDLIEIIEVHPDLLGIGIDENTAIVVQGDNFEVIGRSYVVIYDAQRQIDTGGLFYFLAPGDWYDLASRTPYRRSQQMEELGRVEKRPWGQN